MIAALVPVGRARRNNDAVRLHRATRPLGSLLRQLGSVVVNLSDVQYTQKPVGVVESSVGQHVRHCLEHVRSLLAAIESGRLDYDDRKRGTPVESSRCCALAEIDELVAQLQALPADVMDKPIHMSVTMSSDGEPIDVQSTVGRELAFTLNHTIHHNAIVGAMVKTLGGWLPDHFGFAPSTMRHMDRSQCAR
jgi:uncharacterized damage-inducible protein DinB